jgi:hypothetical protein
MWLYLSIGIAQAAIVAADRWVGNDTLAIGLSEDGSLINDDLELGILWSPGDEAPIGGDMIRVGYEWEIWSWSYGVGDAERTVINAAPHDASDLVLEWTDRVDGSGLVGLRGGASNDEVDIALTAVMRAGEEALIIDATYTALVDLTGLTVARIFDPDQDFWATSTYSTVNESGEGYGVGTGTYDDRALALVGATADGTLGTGGVCHWCTTPDEIIAAAGAYSEDDDHPGVAVPLGDLAAGASVSVRFVYAVAIGTGPALERAWAASEVDDMDGDGFTTADGDCDDWNDTVYTGATEWADTIDNDCDGEVDEDSVLTDDDGDGFSEEEGDCDDSDPEVYPGADPVGGVTNADCDGIADTGGADWYDTGVPDAFDTGDGDTGIPDEPSDDDGDPDDPGTSGETDGESDTAAPFGLNADEHDGSKEGAGCSCASVKRSPWAPLAWLALVFVARRRTGNGGAR